MATGENAGTWGTKTNTNLNLVQQAIAGYESISVTTTTIGLTMDDGSISQARNMVLAFGGSLTGDTSVTVPNSIEKMYILDDQTTHNTSTITFKTASGTGFAMSQGKKHLAYSDGTNINRKMVLDGWAVSFNKEFLAGELIARVGKKGMWKGEFEEPKQWRKNNKSKNKQKNKRNG